MKEKLVITLLLVFCSQAACVSRNAAETSKSSTGSTNNQETANPIPTPGAEKNLKLREEIQNQMLKGENLHDGSSYLHNYGDINSVPALLVVLKEFPPKKNGTMVCTTDHALEALRVITGANPGLRFEDWNNWWVNYTKSKSRRSK